MRKLSKIILALALTSVMFVTGCGSSSNKYDAIATGSEAMAVADEAYYYDDVYEYEESAADNYKDGGADGESVKVQDNSRKLIKNVNMSVETNDMDSLLSKVEERVNAYNGYIENSYVNNGSKSYKYSRSASMTVRIPAEHLDSFLNNVGEVSNIVNKNLSVTDVTLSYVDIEAKRDSLKTQQKRLLELMEQAETVEDIITIENSLTEIRYELESAERQLRSYDNQVNYSTISLDISEVEEYTEVKEPTRIERMTNGFLDSLEGVGEGFLNFVVGFVIALPYLVVWGLIIFGIVMIIRAIIKSSKKKEAKKAAIRAEEYARRQAELARIQAENQAKSTEANEANTGK